MTASPRLPHALAWAAAVAGPLALYALTLPHGPMLEDDGLFLMVGAHLGVAHPPGYPLYTWLCHAFMQLPFGTPAFLGHLSSAVLGALACGFVYWAARLLGASVLPALFAAWLFGASEHFWSQALIAEVYTLNALLFFATYALILYGAQHPERAWPWRLAAAAYGLSLANHWPLMGLATAGLIAAALPARRTLLRRLPGLAGIALPCAALPYAWLVWRSQQEPFINFYGAIDTWERFWFYLSRQGYAPVDISPSAGWLDRLAYLQWLGHEVVWQLTLAGFLLAILGVLVLFRRRQLAAAASSLLAFAGSSLLLVSLLQFDYDFHRVATFRPYPLLCYGLLALWLAVGLQFFVDELVHRLPAMRLPAPWLQRGALGAAGMLMVGSSVAAHWDANAHARDDFAARFAAATMERLPPDSILFASSDAEAFVLGYYAFVEERRPDVQLLNLKGYVYGNRLYEAFLPAAGKRVVLERLLDRTERPVFFLLDADRNMLPRHHKGQLSGFHIRPLGRDDAGRLEVVRDPESEQYFLHLMHAQYKDPMQRVIRNVLLRQYCHYLGLVAVDEQLPPATRAAMQPLFEVVDRNYNCILGIATALLQRGGPQHWDPIPAWLATAAGRRHEAMFKRDLAHLHFLHGLVAERQGREKSARLAYRKSIALNPRPDNDALRAILRLRRAAPERPAPQPLQAP